MTAPAAPTRPAPAASVRPATAQPAIASSGGDVPAAGGAPGASGTLPASFLEVRVGPGRLAVVEFHSHAAARRLEAALARLGLDLETEFDSPCG